jgi:exonuclease III
MSPEVLKVATYNCNSIRTRLEHVLDWLRAEEPHILCLQETKTQDSGFPWEAFQGWDTRQDSVARRPTLAWQS